MSAPVDVLARLVDEARRDPTLIPVHDAVAELIDKADACVTLGRSDTAYRELSVALARVKDGAA